MSSVRYLITPFILIYSLLIEPFTKKQGYPISIKGISNVTMALKNTIYLILIACLFACEEPEKGQIPISSLEIKVDTSKLASLTEYKDFENVMANEKGNVVLVNLWATWCKPCVHEMPLLEKLHQNYKGKGLKVVTLSIDEVSKADSLVIPFWEEMNFSMDNYLIAHQDPGAFVNEIDPLWIGLLPTSFIFNSDGEKIETITGSMNYKGFERKVLKILNNVN